MPPPEPSRRLRGWLQKRPREIPALPEDGSGSNGIKQPRTEPRAQKQLENLSVHIHCINTSVVCQHTPMVESNRLETILPSLQKGIVAPVHAGQIKHFIHNPGLDNTGPVGVTVRTGVLSTTNDDSHTNGSVCRDGIFRRA